MKSGLLTGTLELSRAVRRILVVLMYAVYFGLTVYWGRSPEIPDGQLVTARGLTLAGLVIFAVSYLALNRSTRSLADRFTNSLTEPPLDERQILLRNQAYFWAYLILGPVMFLFYNAAENLGYGWTLIAFISLYTSLPTAVTAWLEPDPIEDTFPENKRKLA